MQLILRLLIYSTSLLIFGCNKVSTYNELTGKKVEIIFKNGKYTLYRNGSPYYIKGASGITNFKLLKQIGGNTIRTYTTENAQQILDSAHYYGLSVMLGVWIEPYSEKLHIKDTNFNQRVYNFVKHEVNKYKDHPALLTWGIGNEVHPIQPNISSWKLLNQACKIAKEQDPYHPVTTCIAGYPRRNMPIIKTFLKDIDFMSYNSFGGLKEFHSKRNNLIYGNDFPYLFSEWGANGYWELIEKTKWESPFEIPHSESASKLTEVWKQFVIKDKNNCLGSFIFFWGQKQEFTQSWYSLFSKNNEKTPIIDSLAKQWRGTIKNYSPQLSKFEWLNHSDQFNIRVNPKEACTINFQVKDNEKDSLSYYFQIRHETSRNIDDFGKESEPKIIDTKFKIKKGFVEFSSPEKAGIYRLFIKVSDGKGGCDLANLPFLVKDLTNKPS